MRHRAEGGGFGRHTRLLVTQPRNALCWAVPSLPGGASIPTHASTRRITSRHLMDQAVRPDRTERTTRDGAVVGRCASVLSPAALELPAARTRAACGHLVCPRLELVVERVEDPRFAAGAVRDRLLEQP